MRTPIFPVSLSLFVAAVSVVGTSGCQPTPANPIASGDLSDSSTSTAPAATEESIDSTGSTVGVVEEVAATEMETYVPQMPTFLPPMPPILIIYNIEEAPLLLDNFEGDIQTETQCEHISFCSEVRFEGEDCLTSITSQLQFCNNVSCDREFADGAAHPLGNICPQRVSRTVGADEPIAPEPFDQTLETPMGRVAEGLATQRTKVNRHRTPGGPGAEQPGQAMNIRYDVDWESGNAYVEYLIALDAHIQGPVGKPKPGDDSNPVQTPASQGVSISKSPIDCLVISLSVPQTDETTHSPAVQFTMQEGHKPTETDPPVFLHEYYDVGESWCRAVFPMADFSPMKSGMPLDEDNLGSLNIGFRQERLVENGDALRGQLLIDDVYLDTCAAALESQALCAPVADGLAPAQPVPEEPPVSEEPEEVDDTTGDTTGDSTTLTVP